MGHPFARLDELTQMMTRAHDELRAVPPKDRETRSRVGTVAQQVTDARFDEVLRLSRAGHPLDRIGEHLDRTDPYRHGVPEDRPVRQRTRATRTTRATRS
jgi:hypothetical protein